jgi:DNA-binding HxlR family transcriptional regulator
MNKLEAKKIKNLESDVANCPVRSVLDRLGDKWTILILLTLSKHDKSLRFGELNKEIGFDISQKMLTISLRTLEADGLVSRKVYPEVPPRVEYKLTKLGHSLIPHIASLVEWADQNIDKIKGSRKKHLR